LRAFAERERLTPLVKRLIERTGYLAWLEERKDAESVDRAANVREFLNVVQRFEETTEQTLGDTSLMAFLQHVALVTDADTLGERGNQVLLMTLHTAKGLEFPVVFLVGLENGLLPHALSETPADIEEERRLCYVGMTRAMDELHLTFAQSRRYYGSRRYSEPSPFLKALKDLETPTLYQLMFGTAPQAAARSATRPSFLPGQRVRHDQYGLGIVVRATDEFRHHHVSGRSRANHFARTKRSSVGGMSLSLDISKLDYAVRRQLLGGSWRRCQPTEPSEEERQQRHQGCQPARVERTDTRCVHQRFRWQKGRTQQRQNPCHHRERGHGDENQPAR
jgi:ATP-dependent exoDNAse (exonuclease V) beta subunit